MATLRNDNNPYEGLGNGGKFRKKPYRRPQATPYDRPPTAVRNASAVAADGRNGWLRKIVDPAQRLITAGAHRLFASVFRKRLTQPSPPSPPPPLPPDGDRRDKQVETVPVSASREQEVMVNEDQGPALSSDAGCFTELEKILTQKTFTRSEIDRLTALLHARTLDIPDLEGGKTEDLPLKPVKGKEASSDSLGQDNESKSRLIKMHGGDDNDASSPAELARAFMGGRPSTVSPSNLGSRVRAPREDSTILSYSQHTSKSPSMSLVPWPMERRGAFQNGYMTPRSRGRSAIYSMARTPYSRNMPNTTLKSVEPASCGYTGPSSASLALEQGGFSGSNALKRRSSIFDNDIGSGGPIRRIRQKQNLLSQKQWSLAGAATGVVSVSDDQPSSSTQRPLSVGEKPKFTDQSKDNEDNDTPFRSMTSVSSKSTEMASKILQQLDKIVSPPKDRPSEPKLASANEKLPAKLSPSKLRGQALKSLEHINSSKFLEMVRDSSRLEDSVGTSVHDAGESTSHKQDKVEQNGPSKPLGASLRQCAKENGLDDKVQSNSDVMVGVKSVDADLEKFHAHPILKKNQGFKMSAHEDYLDLDDDGYSNEEATNSQVKDRRIPHTPMTEHKQAVSEAAKVEKYTSLSGEKSAALALQARSDVARSDMESNDNSSLGVKSSSFCFPSVPLVTTIVQSDTQPARSTSTSEKPSSEGQSNAVSAVFSCDNKEQNAAPPVFGFGLNNGSITKDTNKIPQFSFTSSSSLAGSSTPKFGISSDSKAGSTNSFSVAVQGSTTFPAKVPELDKTDDKNLKDGKISATPELATSASAFASLSTSLSTSTFSFGGVPHKSPILSPSVSLPVSANSNATAVQKPPSSLSFSANSGSSNSSTAETSLAATGSLSTSVPASNIFQFGSSMSTSASLEPPALSASALEVKTKGSDFGNATSNPFSGLSSVNATVGSTGFGFSAPAADAHKQGSSLSSASANGSAQISTFTQNAPVQSGSSAPSFSFGLSGNTTLTSESSLFGSSSAPKLFAGSSFGMSSALSPEANSATSGSSNASNLFGSWQSSSSLVFGTSTGSASQPPPFSFGASTSSNGLTFGSSAPSSASSSAPLFTSTGTASASNGATVFGSNATLSTSSGASIFGSASTFSFTPAASSGPSQSLFGNPNPAFTFSSAPSGSNDQMNAEDSMAEDTVAATPPSVPVFGQQPMTPPSAGFMFNSSAQSAANAFQFGAQQSLPTPLNPSPFQPSGSLDFSAGAGGSFSLGTGGGDKSGRKIIKVKHKQRRK